VDRWRPRGGEVAWQKPDTHPDSVDVVDPPGVVQSSARLDLRNVIGKPVSNLSHGMRNQSHMGRWTILKHKHGTLVKFCKGRRIPPKPCEEIKLIGAKFRHGCHWSRCW